MTMPMNEFFYGGNEQPRWQEIDDYQRPYNFDSRTSKGALPTYEFRVPMCCSKCEEKVREELSELEGACEVFADQLSERVAVTGFVDPFRALKKMKRIKKKSEFWGESSPALKSSHRKKSSHSSHKKHRDHPRHETVYRSSSSQVSYNREPSRTSSSLGHSLSHKKNHASYDDGVSYRNKYGSYDDGVSFRNKRHASYDDGVSYRNKYGSYDDGVSFRNKRGFYDDGVSFRNKYGSFDDGVSYSDLRSSSSRGLSYRPNHASYDDMSYRNHYGSYDDGRVSYSDLTCGPSSSLFSCLPRSRSLRYDTVPPFAQDYYTEDYVEDYPLYNRY